MSSMRLIPLCFAVLSLWFVNLGQAQHQSGGPTSCSSCEANCKKAQNECKLAASNPACKAIPQGKTLCKIAKKAGCRAQNVICNNVSCMDCEPPPEPEPDPAGKGEPHFVTFDGLGYDLQAVGEFLALRSTTSDIEMQLRFEASSPTATMITATSLRVGGKVLTFKVKDGNSITFDSQSLRLPVDSQKLSDDIEILYIAKGYYLVIAGDLKLRVQMHHVHMDIFPRVTEASKGAWIGLFGDNDGDPTNDLRSRKGKVFTKEEATREFVHTTFAKEWRLAEGEPYMPRAKGETLADYTDESFPKSYFSLAKASPEELAKARAVCVAAGVAAGEDLRNCMYDVLATGDNRFANAYSGGAARFLANAVRDPGEPIYPPGVVPRSPGEALTGPSLSTTAAPAAGTYAMLTVDGRADIYSAGLATPEPVREGVLPAAITLPKGARYVEIASVAGAVGCGPGVTTDADGGFCAGNYTKLESADGISGIHHDSRTHFLVGVFTGGERQTAAPEILSFGHGEKAMATNFTEIAPKVQQSFFVGDGRTGSGWGDRQRFLIPEGATHFHLGFSDGAAFTGGPGYYKDNTGTLMVSLRAVSSP